MSSYSSTNLTVTIIFSSSYRLDYIPHDAQRPTPHVPEGYKKPEGDFDLLTSYTKDYPARKAELAKSFKNTHSNHVPTGEFRGNPTYTGKVLFLQNLCKV